jgi:hypothetical protein
LFEAIGRHISEEKEKNGQKKKKKASKKAGTVENARLFRQPCNMRCKFQNSSWRNTCLGLAFSGKRTG